MIQEYSTRILYFVPIVPTTTLFSGCRNNPIAWRREVVDEIYFLWEEILGPVQWRSGRRRTRRWARCRWPTQGKTPWRENERKELKEELQSKKKRICWKPLPPNRWKEGGYRDSPQIWASGSDTWERREHKGDSCLSNLILSNREPAMTLDKKLTTPFTPGFKESLSKKQSPIQLFTTSNYWHQLVILTLCESQILPVSKKPTAHHKEEESEKRRVIFTSEVLEANLVSQRR